VDVTSLFEACFLFAGNFFLRSHLKLVPCLQVNLPKGYGYVEFKARVDAEKAQLYMDGVGFSAMLE
jgi:RNA recognition motif-containing protein